MNGGSLFSSFFPFPTSSTTFLSLFPFFLYSLSPFHSHLLVLHIVMLFALCIPLQQLAQLNSHAPTSSSTPMPFFFSIQPLLVLSRNVMCIFFMLHVICVGACRMWRQRQRQSALSLSPLGTLEQLSNWNFMHYALLRISRISLAL